MGHGPELEREDGAANVLRGLGADVRTLDLWDEPHGLFADDEAGHDGGEPRPRARCWSRRLDRPDLAVPRWVRPPA